MARALDRIVAAAVLGIVGITACQQTRPPQPSHADLIVTNARVHTVDEQRPQATAFAVKDGKFIAVGDDAAMAGLRGDETRVIDARGRDDHSRSQRLARPRDSRRALLQPRAALGRRRIARARARDGPRAGGAHSAGPMGARHRRLVAVPVQGTADADRQGAQRGRAGHADVRALPLQPGDDQPRCGAGARPDRARLRHPQAGATSSSTAARSCTPSRTRRSSTR